jgi:hypothetical protein
VKNDSKSENYVGWKVLDQLKHQGAIPRTKDVARMFVETANINAEDGIDQYQPVK